VLHLKFGRNAPPITPAAGKKTRRSRLLLDFDPQDVSYVDVMFGPYFYGRRRTVVSQMIRMCEKNCPPDG